MQTITQNTLQDTMYNKNIPIFIYHIHYPSFTTTCNPTSALKINQYYFLAAKKAEAYCRTVLYKQAVDSLRYAQSNNNPFNSFTFDSDYTITYNTGCITSLYIEAYTYMGGAHGETKRTSNTWDFKTGTQLLLNDIYPLTYTSLSILQKCIRQQIAERIRDNPGSYFNDYEALLKKSFNPDSFYLREGNEPAKSNLSVDDCLQNRSSLVNREISDLRSGSFVIYFQQYDIAPYSTGLPEFSFPINI